jgi:hypothetical protein
LFSVFISQINFSRMAGLCREDERVAAVGSSDSIPTDGLARGGYNSCVSDTLRRILSWLTQVSLPECSKHTSQASRWSHVSYIDARASTYLHMSQLVRVGNLIRYHCGLFVRVSYLMFIVCLMLSSEFGQRFSPRFFPSTALRK